MRSKQLEDLLFLIRQNPAFPELLTAVEAPPSKDFKPSESADAQYTQFIFRSGQRRQNNAWLEFLIGEPTSEQEKS